MKKLSLLFSAVATLFFYACEKELITNTQDSNTAVFGINLTGDYVNINASPLTRGDAGRSLYGFQIDSIDSSSNYCHYAEGLFDDIKNLTVALQLGHRYRIICSIITERENTIYAKENNGIVYYGSPFSANFDLTPLTNRFVYGETQRMFLTNQKFAGSTGVEVDFAKMDRYYGVHEDMGLRNVNSDISISMKRCAFGIHFIIDKPMGGMLDVELLHRNWGVDGRYSFGKYTVRSTDNSVDESYIIGTSQMIDSVPLFLYVKWTKDSGEEIDLSQDLTACLKTMTTIKVDINDRAGESGFDLNMDNAMTDTEIVIH